MRFTKLTAIFFLFAITAISAYAEDWHSSGWQEGSIQVGSIERWYRVYVPQSLPTHPRTVFLLHGGTQSMRKIFERKAGGTLAWLEIADREHFLLVCPNGTNIDNGDTKGDKQRWNDLRSPKTELLGRVDDVGFIGSLFNWMAQTYGIDTQRVYLTGASNGGMMTYRLLLDLPGRFAAAAPFISSLPADNDVLRRTTVPIPLMITNGTKDHFFHWNGGKNKQVGNVISSKDLVAWWIRSNHADASQALSDTLPDIAPKDGCRIIRTFYPAGVGGAPLLFYKVDGGGHSYPSMRHPLPKNFIIEWLFRPECNDAEGAELAWEFMSKYALSPTQK